NPLLRAFPAFQTQQATVTTIGQGQNPLKTSTPRRPTVVGIRTVCPAGVHSTIPRRAHHGPKGTPTSPVASTGPTACPREKGTIPHASNRTFDRWPLRAPLPARNGRNGNRVACLGPLPAPRRGHQRSPPA